MRYKLRRIVEDNETREGYLFDSVIQILIFISLASFAVETLPDLPELWHRILYMIELVCVVIFSIEYILRIYVAKKPFKYIFSFYGIIDLMAILPFYLHTALDLVALRSLRVFRIFRALKLVRFNRAMFRFRVAYGIVKEELMLFFMISGIMIFLTAAGIYYFENEAQPEAFKSIFHSLWWAVITLTTVGYGDVYPITTGGRVFTFFVLIIGVGIVTVPAGLVASALSRARTIEQDIREEQEREELA